MSVVQITTMTPDDTGCNFYALNVSSDGALSNGLFVFDTTIDLQQSVCQEVNVAVFGSSGDVSNVSAVGTVNMILGAQTKVVLSKMFGEAN